MTCYFRKRDTIVIGLSFLPKILKYRLYNMDSSSVGVSKYIILHLGTYQMDVCFLIFVCRTCAFSFWSNTMQRRPTFVYYLLVVVLAQLTPPAPGPNAISWATIRRNPSLPTSRTDPPHPPAYFIGRATGPSIEASTEEPTIATRLYLRCFSFHWILTRTPSVPRINTRLVFYHRTS
jgi:hypothetical protein